MRSPLLLLCWAGAAAAIKVNWTPNGEAPLPFSQKAREAMGAAGQGAATAAAPLSPVQLALGEVSAFGGLIALLILINLGEPFVLNDWIQPAMLAKVTSRVRELVSGFTSRETADEPARKAAPTKATKSKVAAASGGAKSSETAARKARLAAAAKAKAKVSAAAEENEVEEEAAE